MAWGSLGSWEPAWVDGRPHHSFFFFPSQGPWLQHTHKTFLEGRFRTVALVAFDAFNKRPLALFCLCTQRRRAHVGGTAAVGTQTLHRLHTRTISESAMLRFRLVRFSLRDRSRASRRVGADWPPANNDITTWATGKNKLHCKCQVHYCSRALRSSLNETDKGFIGVQGWMLHDHLH